MNTADTGLSGEEIFLGPKVSFASARQPGRSDEDNKAGVANEESKSRFLGRDKVSKERDGREKARHERTNGNSDGQTTNEGRGYGGLRKTNDKTGEDDEEALAAEEAESRRRAKLDQPWFRGGKIESGGLEESIEPSIERGGWRDRERDRRGDRGEQRNWQSGGRVEQDPQWLKEGPIEADITLKTEADFEAWKQAMKGNNAKDEEDMIAAESSLAAGLARKTTQPITEAGSGANDLTFNLWSEPKREERETSVSTPKTTSKPKSSRFAGFFGPTATEPQQQMQEPARAPSPTPPPYVPAALSSQAAPLDFGGSKPRDEDQEGFQKVMQMLRLGNGSAQNTGILPFGGPPPAAQAVPPQQTSSRRQTSVDAVEALQQQHNQSHPQRQHTIPSAKPHSIQQPLSNQSTQNTQSTNPSILQKQAQQPTNPEPQRPAPPVNRDSEFLLKLMQQPRVPFAEGQIYGQGYNNRKDPAEIASLLGNLNVGQRGQVLGPPPGMQLDDRGGYAPYQQMQGRPKQPPQMHMDDRAVMQSRQMPPQDEQRFQPQPPPGFDSRQHLSRPMMPEGVPPPPGFGPQGRGPQPPQMPPGFFQQPRGMPPLPGHPGYYNSAMPPNAGMPPGFPPGFMQGPPPPGMPQSQQRRRHPSMGSMQPGFAGDGGIDVYPGNHQPRGMQQPQQYQQYMK